ncbi:MAG TPA: metallophosphoesterase [Casimicrobiaceae bacterium]|nr:metallophosphoesterase [Casimicrobiaceae bacterium]
MKLNVLSDLHLSFGPPGAPDNDADVVILAGDIARPREAIAWARELATPVLYVPGNHEFYGGSVSGTLRALAELSAGTNVRVLDDAEVTIDGVRFVGSTLWTDFEIFGTGREREIAMQEGQRFMRDFTRIRRDEASQAPLTPEDAAARFRMHSSYLAERLQAPCDAPTVVVTHHAPSRRSIHPRFEGSPLNACFVSDAEHLIDRSRVQLWVHGHTHDSFDYVVNGTRVVCNPRGYAKDGVNENPSFDIDFIVDVAT